jgi:hypothetical protein
MSFKDKISFDWSRYMLQMILDHIGLGVADPREFALILIALEMCDMLEDKLPKACKLLFSCGSVLQLHEGETSTHVKLAVNVGDPELFTPKLDSLGIKWTVRDPGGFWNIDFVICGIAFHTVRGETHFYPTTAINNGHQNEQTVTGGS